MRYIHLLGLLAGQAAAAAIGANEFDLPVDEVGWSGPIKRGGPEVEYWGQDLEDIEAKIKRDYPDFSIYKDDDEPDQDDDDEILHEDEEGDSSSENPVLAARGVLERRADFSKKIICKKSLGWAMVGATNTNISALKKHKGKCKAKPRTCIRTKCKSQSAIGICNYNKHTISLACSHVGRGGDALRKKCAKFDLSCWPGKPQGQPGCRYENHRMRGEIWSVGKTWKVIVGTCAWYGKGTTRPL